MELLSSNIKKNQETETPKKFPYISREGNLKKAFYILGNRIFQPNSQKIKKIHLEKKFLIFWEMEQSDSKIMKFLIFSEKKKLFLYFLKYIPPTYGLCPQRPAVKIFFIFSQKSPHFFGNGNLEKILMFQETEFSFQ